MPRPLSALSWPARKSRRERFYPPQKSSGFLNPLEEMSTDDSLVFQGQFNRAEPISKFILVTKLPYRTVCALKVDTFGQK